MRRIAWLALPCLLPLAALAGTEDEDTQAPATSPTPFVEFRAVGSSTSKDDAFARQLLDEPDVGRSVFRWNIPVPGKTVSGGHSADLSSSGEGRLRAWSRSTGGRMLELRAFADRRPLALRTRQPWPESSLEPDGDPPETSRGNARLTFTAPVPPLGGKLEVFGEWRGGAGVRNSTAAAYAPGESGPAFLAPAWRDRRFGSATAGVVLSAAIQRTRVALDARVADESSRAAFVAPDRLTPEGGLRLSGDERRRIVEAGVSVDVPAGSLLAGGGYRVRGMQGEARGSRSQDTPTTLPGETMLDDADLRSLSHRGALGVAWLPLPSVRTGITATALSLSTRAESSERRDFADPSVSRGDASTDLWRTSIAADASWIALSRLSVEARASAEASRLEDEWTQELLAPGGETPVSVRRQSLTRDGTRSRMEASATAGPWHAIRGTAGASVENETSRVNDVEAADSPVFGDRTRMRRSVFARVRARPMRTLSVDFRAKAFEDERDLGDGDRPLRRGTDVRGQATVTNGSGIAMFVGGATTEDRYELAPLSAEARAADFLPIEFAGRTWVGTGGVSMPIAKGWRFSAAATEVRHSGDLDSELHDFRMDASGPLNDRLRASAGIRRVEWADDRAPWGDAEGFAGFASLSGTF